MLNRLLLAMGAWPAPKGYRIARCEVKELVGYDTFEIIVVLKRQDDVDKNTIGIRAKHVLPAAVLREMLPDPNKAIHDRISGMFFGVGR